MYTPSASESEATAWGLTLSQIEEVIEIWPDNHTAFLVFDAMGTQWRMASMGGGMAGSVPVATGLDYGSLPTVMQLFGINKNDRAAIFGAVRSMEDEALAAMRK